MLELIEYCNIDWGGVKYDHPNSFWLDIDSLPIKISFNKAHGVYTLYYEVFTFTVNIKYIRRHTEKINYKDLVPIMQLNIDTDDIAMLNTGKLRDTETIYYKI